MSIQALLGELGVAGVSAECHQDCLVKKQGKTHGWWDIVTDKRNRHPSSYCQCSLMLWLAMLAVESDASVVT
jgi:hypothetical protein